MKKLIEKLYDSIMNNKKSMVIFIFSLGLLSTAVLLITKGVKFGDDIYFHLSRIRSIKDSFSTELFPKIYSNYLDGYGYGNPLFYPDIFLYIPAFLNLIGLSFALSYKIFLIIISVASCFTMYITVKGISKNKYAGMISTIIYAFTSYRLVNMFTRGSLGETLAFVFAPLIIYGIYHIIYEDYKKFYILVIGMTGMLLSHVLSSVIIFFVLLIICLINIKRILKERKRLLYLLLSTLIVIAMTSYFIFPMLEQLMNSIYIVNGAKQVEMLGSLSYRAVPFYALFLEVRIMQEPWIPAGMGIVYLYVLYLGFKNKKIMKDKFLNMVFILGMVLWFMSSKMFPWQLLPSKLSIIQFPWRLYLPSTVLLTISAGLLFCKIFKNKKVMIKKLVIVFTISMISLGYFSLQTFRREKIINNYNYNISMAEYLPEKFDSEYIINRDPIVASNDIDFTFKKNNLNMTIDFKNNYNNTTLELPYTYYKGYEATIGNKSLQVSESDKGLVLINLGNIKEGIINVSYEKTLITNVTEIISITTALLFMGALIINKRNNLR